MRPDLAPRLSAWLGDQGSALDATPGLPQRSLGSALFSEVVPTLYPEPWGTGEPLLRSVQLIGLIAEHSMAMAFSLWCHWMLGLYLLRGDNAELRKAWLPRVVSGERCGSTGLANAMKYLSGLESLGVEVRGERDSWVLNGRINWASNLVAERSAIAVPAALPKGRAGVFLVKAEAPGTSIVGAPKLLAMDGSSSGSVRLESVRVRESDLITADLPAFVQRIRVEFLLLQAGFCAGLGSASISSAEPMVGRKSGLRGRWELLHERLSGLRGALRRLADGSATPDARREATRLRLKLGEVALESALLEYEAAGGIGYSMESKTSRRLREALFLPIQSPTFHHLRHELEGLTA